MKIEMTPKLKPRRGAPCLVGNVYANTNGRPHYKIVVSVMSRDKWAKPWNNVVCIKINAMAEIVGCGTFPQAYLSEHNDLVGTVDAMPNLKITWLPAKAD